MPLLLEQNLAHIQRFQISDAIRTVKLSGDAQIVHSSMKSPTIVFRRDNGAVYIHSTTNPAQEGRRYIDQFTNISSYDHVLFYGIGLGYHIDSFIAKYPDKAFSLYEPNAEIFHLLLSTRCIENWVSALCRNLHVEHRRADAHRFLSGFIDKTGGTILVITLPGYKSAFGQQLEAFISHFNELVRHKQANLQINQFFQKDWTANCVDNLPETLNTSNILQMPRHSFENKPAVLAAAGPSLDDDIEYLRHIKESGKAYIFSVGSAINTLVQHGIYPDAACTYDPSEENVNVFRKVIDRDIDTIPLIFGTSTGKHTASSYPGPKLHMVTSQDTVARFYLLGEQCDALECVNDSTSIAVVTLQLLCKLGFNPTGLV